MTTTANSGKSASDHIKDLVTVERDREQVVAKLGTALLDSESMVKELEEKITAMEARHEDEIRRLGNLHTQIKRQFEDTFLQLRSAANAADKRANEATINVEHWFAQCKVIQARGEEAVEHLATNFEDLFAKFNFAMKRMRAAPRESLGSGPSTANQTMEDEMRETVGRLTVVRQGPDKNPEPTKEELRGLPKSSA